MENATVNKTGEVLIYAFRTEFVPKAPNFNANHHCAADQAHISIGKQTNIHLNALMPTDHFEQDGKTMLKTFIQNEVVVF